MSATAPLLAGHSAASVVTWIGGRPVTAAQFCGAARARAAALPSSRHAINLCEDAATFMLAASAAWLRGQAIVLPPDRLVRTLVRMKRDFPDSYCLCDGAQAETMSRECGFAVVRADVAVEQADAWPPPELALSLEAAVLHTSGSTGEPSRHRKSWRELVGGARMLAAALGKPSNDAAVVGTVQPQHMYGLETTIMFPLQCGGRLLPVRPALPAEVGDAVRVARSLDVANLWLFTTPLQLRAFHAAGHVDGIVRVITATMPLDLELARRIEDDWHARVDEIYGCTEGGTLAFRRPTQTDVFTGGDGVDFAVDDAGKAAVVASHLPEPIALGDRMELVDRSSATTSRRMRLLGRDDDLVKVGGKRASLAGLTATLRSLPGVVDGAFFFPTDDAKRLCAVVVAPGASALQIRTALAAAIDGAFLPRPARVRRRDSPHREPQGAARFTARAPAVAQAAGHRVRRRRSFRPCRSRVRGPFPRASHRSRRAPDRAHRSGARATRPANGGSELGQVPCRRVAGGNARHQRRVRCFRRCALRDRA